MLAVAYLESGWRVDVDTGATRGKAGECSLWQIMPSDRGDCSLWADRRVAAGVAHARMRRSIAACKGSFDLSLAAYASGSCDRGHKESRARVDLAQRWYARHPP